jgi:Rhodopirellula transposase DDE domain
MQDAPIVEWIRAKFVVLGPELNERSLRRWAAVEAMSLGRGGISAVSKATGLSRNTIRVGVRELREMSDPLPEGRVRRAGGGRKPRVQEDPNLMRTLESLVEPTTRGDPESPLRWTCKSVRQLAVELRRQRHQIGPTTVARLLRAAGYSLQGNRKTREGGSHPDRDAQFRFINQRVKAFQRRGQPVISVDTKKKELVGDFKNGGREWRPQGQPEEVRVHDFQDPALGKAIPYGVYDLTHNEGWVSVGIDHDTAEFAAEAIRRWWKKMGAKRFPGARELLIVADGGGSNGSRCRLWKVALQRLADRTGLRLGVSHLPPGTSKWNKIEHRLFCHITQNWRGKPLVSHEVIVNLIAHTTTAKGLKVKAELDVGTYPSGIKVSNSELETLQVHPAKFHGDWNYTINPSDKRK